MPVKYVTTKAILPGFKRLFIACLLLQAIFSCKQKAEKSFIADAFKPKITQATFYSFFPEHPTSHPDSIRLDEKKLKKVIAGKPSVTPLKNNLLPAGAPQSLIINQQITTPGTDTFTLPEIIPATSKKVQAALPERSDIKEATYKIPNPLSIASFGKLQGLKHSIITALLQDHTGNIWICTAAGVSRYDGHSFTSFTTDQGLAYNDVRAVCQDRNGNIWFGTMGGGISKYDGYSFTNFTVKDGLPGNIVYSIKEDNLGNIWLGTLKGLAKYDGKTFTNFTRKQGLVNDSVNNILIDKNQHIWIATNKGISKFDGHSFTSYTSMEGTNTNHIQCMTEDKAGRIWLGTYGNGLYIFDGTSFMRLGTKEGLIDNDVFSLLQDRNGNIWAGTHYGLSKFDGHSFTSFTGQQGLVNDNIYSLLQDNAANIWIGTSGGLSKYNPGSFTHITESEGLPKNYIFSFYEDKSKKLWLGSWRGGVSVLDGQTLKTFTDKQGLPFNDVRSIYGDNKETLWFATYKGVAKYDGHSFIYYNEQVGLVNDDVNTIMQDRNGNFWFGTENGASAFDGQQFTNFFANNDSANHINHIMQDAAGNIWFGATTGIFKYDGHNITRFGDENGIFREACNYIYTDRSGNTWFATAKGILRYDGASIIRFTQKEGLINNETVSMLEDEKGNFWITTRFGLSKLSAEKLKLFQEGTASGNVYESDAYFKNYGYADNFLGIGCNLGAILETAGHRIWIGTNNGATFFDPSKEYAGPIPPDARVTAVKIAGQYINWPELQERPDTTFMMKNGIGFSNFHFDSLSRWYNLPQGLSLAYNNNDISFDFAGCTMDQPHTVKYQYQLIGSDKNMNGPTDQSTASYSNLAPGRYTFIVKAMNYDAGWGKEYTYSFIIRPSWWQTWWFRTLATLTTLLIIFLTARFIYQYQLHKQKLALEKELAVQYERQRISSDLHDEIGATLSSINIYSSLAKTESNKEPYLESISANVNDVVNKLDDLVWKINPKYDTLDSVIYRLMFFAEPLALAKNVSISLKAGDELRRQKLDAETKHQLFLVLKELLNNALKHSGCKTISIVFSSAGSGLQVVVEDDGKGYDEAAINTQRNGLRNIASRVQAMRGTIATRTGISAGTQTTISLPLA
ncbi:MAG TPA: two-component regulator propeller domain-containing protein [Chitinophagaceae bacterium]|nr:two-component regulator propeller domain-containing protein [Chitinophagaceae bacterium]